MMISIVTQGPARSWWSLLCESVKNGDTDTVGAILKEHPLREKPTPLASLVDKQPKSSVDTVLSESPLHLAILHGKTEIVDLLLSHGIDITVTNLYGETPLHVACRTGDTDIVKKLLQLNAEIDHKDCGECTPLFHAIYSQQTAVVDILIRAGCDLDTLNEELMTPLDHAVCYNQTEIISLLLKGGCAIEKTMGTVYYPGHYSNSILFSLWSNSDIDNVKVLIAAGYQLPYSHLIKLVQVARQLQWDDSLLHAVGEMIRHPTSLKGFCRITVRRHLMNIKYMKRKSLLGLISELPIPGLLRDYVSML